MDRVHAGLAVRAAGRLAVPPTLIATPDRRSIGHVARGRQMLAGQFLADGAVIAAQGRSIWDIGGAPSDIAERQGCAWIDDLAALGGAKARDLAQGWVAGWIERFGDGSGPGWVPDLTARRLIRLISHGAFLLRGQDAAAAARFHRSLAAQTLFLGRRWHTAAPGLPRFEAMTGMVFAGLTLSGMDSHVPPVLKALSRDCETGIAADGGIATRNPEALLDLFTWLTWAVQALTETDHTPPEPVLAALARMIPTLRALRHADGGLARFHGGGQGVEGRLDQALAASGIRQRMTGTRAMGYARLAAGRTTLIVDADRPPVAAASADGHASTLAFELTSGRRPVIVNCGSGKSFGPVWRKAGRATASHSTLGVDGYSSSRFAPAGQAARQADDWLTDTPMRVICEQTTLSDGMRLELAHDGWVRTHGLTHARTLDLGQDGRALAGEDMLTTLSEADKARFDALLAFQKGRGIAFSIRFHLHPEVHASIDMGGSAISIALKSGEVWIFRQDGMASLTLESSVHLENGRLRPRPAQQVVLSGRAMSYATRVRWSLAKAQDTPVSLRDLAQDHGDADGTED
jgi:uncharacterized heparinase superfamily protein